MSRVENALPAYKRLLVILTHIIGSLLPSWPRVLLPADALSRPERYRRCGCTGGKDCGQTVEHFVLWGSTRREREELNAPFFADAEEEMGAWDGSEENDD